MIDQCKWGTMIIQGNRYDSDLKVFPDGTVKGSWWRRRGHRLSLADIGDLLAAGPEIFVVGTGVYAMMKPEAELQAHMSQKGIELLCLKTQQAAEAFNQAYHSGRKAAGCFHLTC